MAFDSFNGFVIILIILLLFVIGLVIKCCLDVQPKKVTRRRHRGSSYEDVHEPVTNIATARPQQSRIVDNDALGFDDIVIVPDMDKASPVVVPPYPVEPRHPTPHAVPPGPGFATHNPPYPIQTPHPVPGATPYPPAVGQAPYPPMSGVTPYPPTGPPVGTSAPYSDYGAQPPSYSEAVLQPPVQPLPAKEGYSKQAPYNPNY